MATDGADGGGRGDRVRLWARRVLLCGVFVLFVVSVPWYRESGASPGMLLGLPDWVAVALLCYVAAAILTSLSWLLTPVRDPDRPAAGRGP